MESNLLLAAAQTVPHPENWVETLPLWGQWASAQVGQGLQQPHGPVGNLHPGLQEIRVRGRPHAYVYCGAWSEPPWDGFIAPAPVPVPPTARMFSQLSPQCRRGWDKDIDSRPIKSAAAAELGRVANHDSRRLGFLEDPESSWNVGWQPQGEGTDCAQV